MNKFTREGFNNAVYFIGSEIEHSPAFSKKTLFVVGKQQTKEIESIARKYKTPHIYLGTSHSFDADNNDPYWDQTITALLDKGFWVTLDYQAHQHEQVLKMLNPGIWQCRTFVPMLSVRIPKVQTSSPNLTIKIDDSNFAATNPGVWCLHFREITDSNRFTDWSEYTSDEIIESSVIDPVSTGLDGALKVSLSETEEISIKNSVDNEIKNDSSLGIDPISPSQLKPTSEEIMPDIVNDANTTAEAYAEGTTEDQLTKTPILKKTKVKKTTDESVGS